MGWILDRHYSLSAQGALPYSPSAPLGVCQCLLLISSRGHLDLARRSCRATKAVGRHSAGPLCTRNPKLHRHGMEVDDAYARECAHWFYAHVLGLDQPDGGTAVVDSPLPPSAPRCSPPAEPHSISRRIRRLGAPTSTTGEWRIDSFRRCRDLLMNRKLRASSRIARFRRRSNKPDRTPRPRKS